MTADHLALIDDALRSLYADEIVPTQSALKGRLSELTNDQAPDLIRNFMALYRSQKEKYRVTGSGHEKVVELLDPAVTSTARFVEPSDQKDPYDAKMWRQFGEYLNDLQRGPDKPSYVFSRGRYGMACELRRRNLPFLQGYSLGQMCHIVQLGITKRNLICYEDNELKPVSACVTMTRALLGEPQTPAHENDCPHVESVAEFLSMLHDLMPTPRDSVLLAMLKRRVRCRFNKRISETALRCTKLSEVLALPEVTALFSLDKPNEKQGYIIRPRAHGDTTPPQPQHRGRVGSGRSETSTGASTNASAPVPSTHATPLFAPSMFVAAGGVPMGALPQAKMKRTMPAPPVWAEKAALGHAPEFFDSQPRVRAPVEDLAELPPMLMPAPVRSHVLASGADVPLHTSHWNAWP